jgi:hypothetical protein
MRMLAGFALGLLLVVPPIAPDPPLTEDGLRAWLVSAGTIDASKKSIHEGFAEQRAKLPPWWPVAVADQEEEALLAIDMVPVALPFYQPCFTEPEARVLAKRNNALAEHGETPGATGTASKAQTKTDTKELVQALTKDEMIFASKRFTPARVAAFKKCSDDAYAKTSVEVSKLEEVAINGVVDKNRPQLVDAKTAWVTAHPDSPQ